MMSHIMRHYCVECEWAISFENHSRKDLAAQAVEHAIETGHDIESAYRVDVTEIDSSDRSDSDASSDGHRP